MTGVVTNLFSCPRCMSDMSAIDKPKECPKCGFYFYDKDSGLTKSFAWHKSPYRQLYELVQQDLENLKGKPISEFSKNLPDSVAPDDTLRIQDLNTIIQKKRQTEMQEFFLNSTPLQIEDWFQSFMHLFQTAHLSRTPELIMLCTKWGKRYGEYAKITEELLRQGPIFYERPK